MRRLLGLLLVALICPTAAIAQNIDSLVSAGHRHLATYSQTLDLADARKAHSAFSAVLRRQKNHPQAHLGLGLAYAATEGQQLDPLGFNDVTRITNNSLAIQHLLEALRAGVADARAIAAITTVATREYDEQRINDLIDELKAIPLADEAQRAAAAELFLAGHQPAAAVDIMEGAESTQAKRILAVASLFDPQAREAAGAAYLEALAAADSALLERFILDARWLADAKEAETWRGFGAHELKLRLRSFWERRALVSAVSTAERLATHFKRVQIARDKFNFYKQRVALFVPDSLRRVDIGTPALSAASGTVTTGVNGRLYHVDDRAFIYVRYGEPDRTIRTRGPTLWNESWVYHRLADGNVSFDFFLPVARNLDARGWTLYYDIMHCGRTTRLGYSEDYLRDRQSVDPVYTRLLQACSVASNPSDADAVAMPFVEDRQQFLTRAMTRDNAVPPTIKNIPLLTDIVQFRGDAGSNDVTAVVAWPVNEFKAGVDGMHRTHLTFFIADTLHGHVSRKDTTVVVRGPVGSAATARVHVPLGAPPANRALYRITLRDLNDPGVVTVIGDTIDVRSLHLPELQISDIAIAGPGDGGSWRRLGKSMSLLPRGFPVTSFRIYYELYNVPPGAEYQTRITFRPTQDALAKLLAKLKGSQTVSFEFRGENSGSSATVGELQAMNTELPAGEYMLELSVASAGRTARAEKLLRIPERPSTN